MKRVSSRQRLVSWDAFDATAQGTSSGNDDSSISDFESSPKEDANDIVTTTIITGDDLSKDMFLVQRPSAESYASLKRKRGSAKSKCHTPEPRSSTVLPKTIPAFCWEVDAPPCPAASLAGVPDDVRLGIVSFLEPGDVQNVMQTCKKFRHLLLNDEASLLWKSRCQTLWPQCPASTTTYVSHIDLPMVVSSNEVQVAGMNLVDDHTNEESLLLNYNALLQLAPKTTPSEVDQSLFAPCRWSRSLRRYRPRPGPSELQTIAQEGMEAVQFTGTVGAGDRCIRSNEPWAPPIPLKQANQRQGLLRFLPRRSQFSHRRIRPSPTFLERLQRGRSESNVYNTLQWKPFVVPFACQNSRREEGDALTPCHLNLTPRLVHYFEVSILAGPEKEETRPSTMMRRNDAVENNNDEEGAPLLFRRQIHHPNASDCVAVGISCQDFPLHTRMPGWDTKSYGYHGDDGGVFYATGHMLREYGPTFGVGDVVGCGVDYHKGNIFFTLNGQYLGPAWQDLQQDGGNDFYDQHWYPTVGMDTTSLVHCNFGMDPKEPFRFDLTKYIEQHHGAVIERAVAEQQQQTRLNASEQRGRSHVF